jgi:hypothetical protein
VFTKLLPSNALINPLLYIYIYIYPVNEGNSLELREAAYFPNRNRHEYNYCPHSFAILNINTEPNI